MPLTHLLETKKMKNKLFIDLQNRGEGKGE